MTTNDLVQKALKLGATHAAPVKISDIKIHPSLRQMCEMNACGSYGTNWGCPPGCGDMDALSNTLDGHSDGIVYQYVGELEDSFDIENMTANGERFSKIAANLKEDLLKEDILVLGAGMCFECETCTYPDEPCRHPDRCTIPIEACGINVSELCALARLNYINGVNTVTYTGLIALPKA